MCGITGWIDWERDLSGERLLLERMVQTLQPRGPDSFGIWLSTHVALAHRRLCVIDPLGGVQPMTSQRDGYSYTTTFNGEIYNFKELRSELEIRGHTFRTYSDTEVLLHAYIEWGEDCLHRLNGIFAFALWDEARQQLLLARDHLGVKPLFYAQRASSLIFGSELKALLAHPLVQPEVDAEGLAEIFTWARTPGLGIYRNVYELRAGHYAIVNRAGMNIKPYWKLTNAPHTDDLSTTVERLRALLEDSVSRQLIADVPLVAMLSGGVDSSGLVALAARELQRQGKALHTYSLDFVDSARDFQPDILRPELDAPWAQGISEFVGTTHHAIIIDTPELLDHILVPLRARDLPNGGQLDTVLYLLCKALKQDATVAISGESADEVFGGYHWFNLQVARSMNTLPWVPAISFYHLLSPEVQAKIQPEAYLARRYQEALAEIPRLPDEHVDGESIEAKMRELFYLSQTRFLSIMLDRKDRMSMAAGLEVRVPYCDYRIVEYMWNVPWKMKALNQIEKGLLRHAFVDLLPNDARMRRKSVFPVSRNPSYLRAIQQIVQDILNAPNSPVIPLIDRKKARDLAEGEALPEQLSWTTYYLDSLIQINAWLSEYQVRLCL